MSSQINVTNPTVTNQGGAPNTETSVWWLVCKWELTELWLGGRVFNFLILFSVLMSITAYLMGTNAELSLTPTDLTVLIMLQAAITFGLFIGLIVAAESISGERERATLETLLITPTSRRQLVFGKLLAAFSTWPVAMLIAVPYIITLSHGDAVLGPALFWGSVMGSLLAATFTGVGILVSIWSNANRISLFVSLLLYLLCLLPSQVPGQVQSSASFMLIQIIDPVEATNKFLQRMLVAEQPPPDAGPQISLWLYLAGCVAVTAIVLSLLFLYAAPRIQLEGSGINLRRFTLNRMQATKSEASQ